MGGGEDFNGLLGRLTAVFDGGVETALSDGEFNELALAVYRFQCAANPPYGAFARARRGDPEGLDRWEEVPLLPTLAFKDRPLVAGDPARVERVFLTSGTTGGREKRGAHHVLSLELYRRSLLPNFRAHLLPAGEALSVLCLLPPPESVPESSLSFMMGEVIARMGDLPGEGPEHGFFVDPGGGVRAQELLLRLREAEEAGTPVLLAGTAFAFLHWLDTARERGWRLGLPPGSRIMETGGYKGWVRALPREELYAGLESALGVPMERVVNEYGMTELLSQFYEPVLTAATSGENEPPFRADTADRDGLPADRRVRALASRFHRAPPWVRTRVLDPLTLDAVPPGETGILAHFDLANLGSVSAVLTQDLGRTVPGGFQLQGRSPGAEPRGCSLAMEDFLAAGGGGR